MTMSDQNELGLGDVKLPRASVEKARLLTDLLERATSLGVVSEFLKAKGLRYSAVSWDEMPLSGSRASAIRVRATVTLPRWRDPNFGEKKLPQSWLAASKERRKY